MKMHAKWIILKIRLCAMTHDNSEKVVQLKVFLYVPGVLQIHTNTKLRIQN